MPSVGVVGLGVDQDLVGVVELVIMPGAQQRQRLAVSAADDVSHQRGCMVCEPALYAAMRHSGGKGPVRKARLATESLRLLNPMSSGRRP